MENSKKSTKGITVKKSDDMPEWYTQVVLKSELADYSAVKGCAVIRPLGYALWQEIMDYFNNQIKKIGVKNAYFPMFIPESFFLREADHVEGFAPEVAWVEKKTDSEEKLAVRPTSETIMYDSYSKWIRSHRDLPLRINQWCNIVRWEVSDVKLFLRSREFLWQEGHCVYETEKECDKEVFLILDKYAELIEDLLAVPVLKGLKSKKETFAGAKFTTTVEAFMPDGKALQCGTSHNLGQGFAKAFNISFKGRDEKEKTPWQSSWGFSTRLIGALIMTHSDDKGLVLPPKIAPTKVVVVPILTKKDKTIANKIILKAEDICKRLNDSGFETFLDDRSEYSPGFKFNEWELKGVPLRIEIGPKDLEKESVVLVKRNSGEKLFVSFDDINCEVGLQLSKIQKELFDKAKSFVDGEKVETNVYDDFLKLIENRKLVLAHHCGGKECEDLIKEETVGATTRCRPFGEDNPNKDSKCIKCGKPAEYKILFSKNY